MKRNFTKILAAFALLVGLTIPMGMWGQTRVEESLVALTFPDDNSSNNGLTQNQYLSTWTAMIDDYSWSISNFNNNNWGGGWTYIKCGRKNNASVANITTSDAYPEAVTKVSITIDAITTSKVNSITLFISSDGSSWTSAGNYNKSTGVQTVTLANPTADQFYKIEFDCQSGSSNGLVTVSKVEYFYDNPSGTLTCEAPTFNPAAGTYTEAQTVTISCATEGATIYYTTNGDEPTTSSTVYAAPISVSSNMTIKAMAAAQGYDNSAVATAAYTIVNIQHAGTEADPYTVADARTAIDANAGTQGVYATGIVSAIPTAWNGQYNNITFNFVDNEGDTDFLQAYRCVSTDNADASTVAVGDVVVVFGDLTKYGSTYEFNSGCQLVSLTHPTVAVEAPTFSPAAGIYDEAQDVTLSCATDGATIYYTTDGSEPTTASTLYSTAINVATTTTIKAIAVKGEDSSAVATATYTIVPVANISSISEVGTDYTVRGTVVAINSRGFIMGDGTGYVYYYKNDAVSQSVGDKVKVLGTTGSYGHIIQFTNSATVTEATTSNYNNTPAAILITEVPDYTEGYYLSTYFEFEGELTTTSGNYLIALGESQIQISYPTQAQKDALNALSEKNVHVKGYFSGINSSNKFTVMLESVEEVASTEPSITVTPVTVSFAATGTNGVQIETLAITFENIEIANYQSFTVQFYDNEGNETTTPTDWPVVGVTGSNDEGYSVRCVSNDNTGGARTAYFKIYAYDANNNKVYSDLVTVNQAAYVAPTVATLPFEYDGNGQGELPAGFTVDGLGTYSSSPKMQFNGTGDWAILHFDERPGTLTFDIKGNSFSGGTFKVQTSEDGTNYSDLATYTSDNMPTSVQSEEFNNLGENVRYIKWIYTQKSSGNVALGNIALAKYIAPQAYTLTIGEPEHITLTATYGDEVLDNGDVASVFSGTEITLAVTVAEGYMLQNLTVDGEESVTVTETSTLGVYTFEMPAFDVTINATAAEVVPVTTAKYVKVTSTTDLTSGQYLIVYEDGSVAFDGSLDELDVADNIIEVTIQDDEINATTAAEFTIDMTAGTIKSASGYYIGQTTDANGMKTSEADAYTNTISIDEDGNAVVVASGGAYLRYNSDSNAKRFRYYKSSTYTGQKAIQLYKKEDATPAGPTITVNGYGDTNGGYVLLAWPESTSPTAINGMISDDLGTQVTPENPGTYDLYSYDESQAMEWRNYRTNSFELVPGKGYLYASKAGVTLTYEGEASPVFADVNLPYTENKIVKSIYLAGNSQTNEQTFYVYNDELAKQSFNYLTMNEDGNGFISAQATSYTAPAMTGFFVQAPGANMTLSTTDVNAKANVSLLNINVLRNRGSVIDNAIVSFSNGSMMDKFYLMNNTTRVYIPQGNREMAIANSAAQGEMPVSFRASENGTYTIAVEAENVDMNYLHLIDNMTGADVDLLATPNYTFEARTNDYTSRFRLVFSANGIDEQTAETFAFFNGTSWTVSNTGDATLQVVDITGRIISSETINGNATVSLNQPAGIYMLRLVNGNDVKVQKVVVR